MSVKRKLRLAGCASMLTLSLFTTSCAVQTSAKRDDQHVMEVSVPMQKMALYRKGELIKTYPFPRPNSASETKRAVIAHRSVKWKWQRKWEAESPQAPYLKAENGLVKL